MNIGILGSGMVGKALATALVNKGHNVVIGTRDPGKLAEWAATQGENLKISSPSEAAQHAEIVLHATSGQAALQALESAGAENLKGKLVIDISNPLDFSKGFPPTLFVKDEDSLAEQIQRAFPEAKVVKTLNTLTADLMLNPGNLNGGDHTIFLSGNDQDAKNEARAFLESFGWQDIIDLGDITTARGTEMFLALWVRIYGSLGKAHFNIKIVQ
ncbi:NADPH-dependent F420 reductase [Deinococcus cellulosilyticus]|uniref:DNA-binding protein n=1 Tax=Deinococcus cellulosilyticus (strain DSM 18568 / NBRC 106333 / KACC 11606 / 5516J-15) TaxID=1223518 RepID=A0A511MXH7_DEIC1|nr:NAD(P)-binding domain-containing protein [Deinococcus cellulosilyticus]GEM44968.1 DNA-binding protein [Deinococcus cellulosilyticus NBRC 106333 = KACC 11606]